MLKERTASAATLGIYAEVNGKLDKLINQADHEAFDLAMACVLANGRSGDAVAMFIVAPSSTAKTEIIQAMTGVSWAHLQSQLTPKTFASGLRKSGFGKDPSLLTKFSDQGITCLINKEFTTVLNISPSDRDEILSQMREIMDGRFIKDFGNGAHVDWEGKLGMLVGVTPIIDRYWAAQTNMGDRWVWVRQHSATTVEERMETALAALQTDDDAAELRKGLKTL